MRLKFMDVWHMHKESQLIILPSNELLIYMYVGEGRFKETVFTNFIETYRKADLDGDAADIGFFRLDWSGSLSWEASDRSIQELGLAADFLRLQVATLIAESTSALPPPHR
jgi:hypothetical protein